jgi:predicted alpha/beta hydrolase family esterase
VFGNLKKRIDLLAIAAADKLSQRGVGEPEQANEARRLLAGDFLNLEGRTAVEPSFRDLIHFTFNSPQTSPWPENNRGHGQLHRCGVTWRSRPTLILLHGWNAELCYRHLFPYLAGRARKRKFNTLFFELPLHSHRRPRADGAVKDWISDNLLAMLGATRQALWEIEGLAQWLRNEASPAVITWGLSLGGWLAGLHSCHSSSVAGAVLATPVARMDLLVNSLSFCAPVRDALMGNPLDLSSLNLETHRPRVDPGNILLLESVHDQFVPPETIEDLHRRWEGSELWRVPHGHISVLFALPTLKKTLDWVQRVQKDRSYRSRS